MIIWILQNYPKELINIMLENAGKSMLENHNYKIWQDFYRPVTKSGEVYLKLIVIDDVLILSFKEL